MSRRTPKALLVCLLALSAGYAGGSERREATVLSPMLGLAGLAEADPLEDDCPFPGPGFDCDMRQRVAAANAYLMTRPGTVGYVLRDRASGDVYRNAQAAAMVWTASTIKLAIVADLFTRSSKGLITLDAGDRSNIQKMLHSSDDDAANALWYRYAGADHLAFNNDFPAYGMSDLRPQAGFASYYPYWGFQKCTANDLDRLVQYVLDQLPAADTAYILSEMRSVDPDQQWGVWGAGPAMRPGNKDGWSQEQGGWVVNSAGFAGADQRYTLSIMNALGGQGVFADGARTDSHLAELLLAGRG